MLQLSCNKMYVTLSVFSVWLASSSRTRDGIKLPQELSVMIYMYVNTGITLLHFQCKSSVQFLTLLQMDILCMDVIWKLSYDKLEACYERIWWIV